jgi:malonyl-CoA/methylmalonyl-CoA synthetase
MASENLYDLFASRFPADRAKPFLTVPAGRSYSYADMEGAVARIAAHLVASGVRPGDRVAVQVEKSPEAVFLYLACLRAGAVYLPLNPAYRSDELDYFLADAEPALVVGDPAAPAFAELARARGTRIILTLDSRGQGTLITQSLSAAAVFATVPRGADDLAAILYSSGTTGRPKGVMLSHRNLAANALTLHRLWQFRPDDVLLHALPIFHTHGLFVALNTTLLNGSPMIFHEKFVAADVLRDLPRATVFMGVPTYYVRLVASADLTADRCRAIRLFLSGSAPLLDETFRQFEERTGRQIVERYGMTEAGMITSARLDRPRRAGSVGWPLPDVELRIVAEDGGMAPAGAPGVIQIRGPNVFRGYWKKPDKTAEDFTTDGWFKTGDVARIDGEGRVAIIGRAKDMIISGGFNVYPKEIEETIDALPGVDESAVVGMPHPDFGEAGLAVVTFRAGVPAMSPEQIVGHLKAHIANYKVPKMVITAPLPRNAMGKVQKNVLRESFRAAWDSYLAGDKS